MITNDMLITSIRNHGNGNGGLSMGEQARVREAIMDESGPFYMSGLQLIQFRNDFGRNEWAEVQIEYNTTANEPLPVLDL